MPETTQVFASEAGGAGLPETRWTTMFQVGSESSAESQAALSLLCNAYWYPLYAFARRKGQSPEDAKDLVQEFFARQLLRANQNCFVTAHRVQGRFRSYLLTAFTRFASDQRDRAKAKKRHPGYDLLSIDKQDAEGRYLAEPADELDPAMLFEWRWAMDMLNETHRALEQEYGNLGKLKRYEVLRCHLQEGRGTMTYAEAGLQLGISEGAVTQEVFVMRRRFGEILCSRIRDTVESDAEVEEEIAHMINIMSRGQ